MSEDDIRTKVVYPWLVASGFKPAEISIEFSFEIRLGRSLYRIGGPNKTTKSASAPKSERLARPRTDVLVRLGVMNLMIVEVKAPNESIDATARDQGISYARLLPQIAPFVVVTNGSNTAVYDSITREELSGGLIPHDHPGLKGGFRVSADELRLRAEALETFASLSPENLLVFCDKQLEYRMRQLRDTDPSSGKKYIPCLYVNRKKSNERIVQLLDDRQARVVAVFGRPQVGKTNLLCRFAEDRVLEGHAVLFYPAISLNAGLLIEIADDFGWILGDHDPVAVLASKLGQILRHAGSRLTLIIDGWNEAEVETARKIDRECERICSGDRSIQLVISFTHSAAYRLLVHAGNPAFLAEAVGIGLRGFEIIESDPSFAARQPGWSAVSVDPYNPDEQEQAYELYADHFAVTVPDSHRRTGDPYLLAVAMRHFAGRTLPDAMDEPELIRAWLEARIARTTSCSFDIRSALTELASAMIAEGSPLSERSAKRCWGLPAITPIPPALSELALLANLVGGSERYIDFYNSRDRDYVISHWAFRWSERLSLREILWEELADVARARPGVDAVAWFFRQPTCVPLLLDADRSLPTVPLVELRRVFLASLGQLVRTASHDFSNHYERWMSQCREWATSDTDLRCRVEATKLMVGMTEEEEDLLAVFPSDESQRAFVHGLLEVLEEYASEPNGLGQFVIKTFEQMHIDPVCDNQEEDSSLTLILDEECNHPFAGIRTAARMCLGALQPRKFLGNLGTEILGREVPDEYLAGIDRAVSAIVDTYYGNPMCKSYMSFLERGDERAESHYREELQAFANLSRFTNVTKARQDLRDIVLELRAKLPAGTVASDVQEPRCDAPGQLYLFD